MFAILSRDASAVASDASVQALASHSYKTPAEQVAAVQAVTTAAVKAVRRASLFIPINLDFFRFRCFPPPPMFLSSHLPSHAAHYRPLPASAPASPRSAPVAASTRPPTSTSSSSELISDRYFLLK
jgi:hypothetical protein